jgi:hypothetical protein
MPTTDAPRIGDNTQIDYAADETRRLEREYGNLKDAIEGLVAEAEKIPLPITDPEGKAVVAPMIKRLRDQKTSVEGLREIEKMPHLRRGNAVDAFFGSLRVMLLRDDKKSRLAIGDVLQSELTTYDERVLAEEMERRRREAAKAAEELRKKLAAEEAARRAEEETRLAAERARKAETQAAKSEVAEQAAVQASVAAVKAKLAETRAEASYVETLARPADVMRQRMDNGVMSTMGTEKFSEILDRDKLDLEKLRPFFKLEHLEQAVRGYAASRGHSNDPAGQIPGARFGTRAKSLVR